MGNDLGEAMRRTDFAYKHRNESRIDCNHPCEDLTFYGHTTEGARQHGWATLVAQGAKEVTTAQIDSECSNREHAIYWERGSEPRRPGGRTSSAQTTTITRTPK